MGAVTHHCNATPKHKKILKSLFQATDSQKHLKFRDFTCLTRVLSDGHDETGFTWQPQDVPWSDIGIPTLYSRLLTHWEKHLQVFFLKLIVQKSFKIRVLGLTKLLFSHDFYEKCMAYLAASGSTQGQALGHSGSYILYTSSNTL